MSRRVITILNCDRCKNDFDPRENHWDETISDLKWMQGANGAKSGNSNMAWDLCQECTSAFLSFMKLDD